MPTNPPRTAPKAATKPVPKYHRLSLAGLPLEKQAAQQEKIFEEAKNKLAEIRGQIAARNHAKAMEVGARAIQRRLEFFSDKFWTQYSDRLQKILPEEPDQQHLVYWLEHRPRSKDAAPSTKPAELSLSDAQKPEADANQSPQEPTAAVPPDNEQTAFSSSSEEPILGAQPELPKSTEEPASDLQKIDAAHKGKPHNQPPQS